MSREEQQKIARAIDASAWLVPFIESHTEGYCVRAFSTRTEAVDYLRSKGLDNEEPWYVAGRTTDEH